MNKRVIKQTILSACVLAIPSHADVKVKVSDVISRALSPQVGKKLALPKGTAFKIKSVGDTTSATARKGDYVEFVVAEDVLSPLEVEKDGQRQTIYAKVIAKGTVVFGQVIEVKHRHFPFRNGRITVGVSVVVAVDGNPVAVTAYRPQPASPPQIQGRRNAAVAPLVPAVAAAGSVYLKDRTARNIAILTLLATSSVGELLNGTDAKVGTGEVFNVVVANDTEVLVPN